MNANQTKKIAFSLVVATPSIMQSIPASATVAAAEWTRPASGELVYNPDTDKARSRLLEAVLGALEPVPTALEERPALTQQVECLLRIPTVELDVREQLVRARSAIGVLGHAQHLEGALSVAGGRLVVVALGMQP